MEICNLERGNPNFIGEKENDIYEDIKRNSGNDE